MAYGILRVSETEKSEIQAARAFVMVQVTSDKLVFGNAAVSASEDLKRIVEEIKSISAAVDVDTESVSVETSSGLFTKSSAAHYTVKLTVADLTVLGAVLGACSTGKNARVLSVAWDYDEEDEKLTLIKKAVQKAKHKADQMMEVIGYTVTGIRSCSDSYEMPHIGEIVLSAASAADAEGMSMLRARKMSPHLDVGTQFKSKKEIAATCTMEFLIEPVAEKKAP